MLCKDTGVGCYLHYLDRYMPVVSAIIAEEDNRNFRNKASRRIVYFLGLASVLTSVHRDTFLRITNVIMYTITHIVQSVCSLCALVNVRFVCTTQRQEDGCSNNN